MVLEKLFKMRLKGRSVETLWNALRVLPFSCRVWFRRILSTVPTSILDDGDSLPIECWVGNDVQSERLSRGIKSKFVKWSPTVHVKRIRQQDFTAAALALELSEPLDRDEAVKQLARHGNNLDNLILELMAHSKPPVRRGALQIVSAREALADIEFGTQLVRTGIADTDKGVRAAACQLASRLKLWNILSQTARTDQEGKVRAAGLRGLATPGADWTIPTFVLERALESREPIERYWACLVAKERKLVEVVAIIRPLTWDTTSIAATGYQKDHDWPGCDEKIGHSVAAAAHAALAILLPASEIWRNHKEWQLDFAQPTPRES